jgi:protein tyrosine/serine phosphatase
LSFDFNEQSELIEHLPNFRVVNEKLSRGGQPSREGFLKLKSFGVKTVVNLREDSQQALEEEKLVQVLGMDYESIPLNPFFKPKDKDIEQFLRLALTRTPIFVHCLHGQDRTGATVCIYRMLVDGLDYTSAVQEMHSLGFHREFALLTEIVEEYKHRRLQDVLALDLFSNGI